MVHPPKKEVLESLLTVGLSNNSKGGGVASLLIGVPVLAVEDLTILSIEILIRLSAEDLTNQSAEDPTKLS